MFQSETRWISFKILPIAVAFFALIVVFQNCSPSSSVKSQRSNSISAIDSVEDFSKTLHPILKQNCGPCHGVSQVPMFAVSDATYALAAIKQFSLVDLSAPANSRFVRKILEGHNGFPASLATSVQFAIEDWAQGTVTLSPADTELPTVSITSPSGGQTIAGTYNVQAIASDNVGVTKVTLRVDGNSKGQATTSPYVVALDTTTLSDGSHEIRVLAQDAAGNERLSSAVSVNVGNSSPTDSTPPVVTFTAPASGATVSGDVTLAVTATDNVAVMGISFYLDGGTQIGSEDTSVPYSVVWNSSTLVNGQHKIQALATDTSGNMGISQELILNVTGGKVINNPNAKFSWILANIFQNRCTSCHGATKNSGGVRLHTYANVMDQVRPPNPNVSRLYNAVATGGNMPPSGGKLTAAQIQAISDWIQLGAQNN